MKWTRKLILLLVAMAAAVAFLSMRTAQGTDDSSDGPLYQNTLNQAFTEMRTVRNVPESNEHGEDLLLGGKPEPTKKPRNTNCPPDTRCPVKGTKCPKNPNFTKCEVTHNKDARTTCFDTTNYTKCRAKTYCLEEPTKCIFPWATKCKVTHGLGSSGRTRCLAPKTTLCLAKNWCWPVPHDLGVTMIEPPGPTGCNPYVPTVHVKNFGLEPASFFDVFVLITTSGDEETKTIEDILNPGEVMTIEFSPIPLPEGDHEICATTIWTPDQNPDNDEMCAPFHCGAMDGPALSSRTRIEARALALFDSYPNPFSDRTSISFMIPNATHVSLEVYDVTGSAVAILVDAEKTSGLYTVTWDAPDLNNGVYFYRMVADGKVFTGKTTLIR